jgi:hypothetical protein
MSVIPTPTSPIIITNEEANQPGIYTGNLSSEKQKNIYQSMLNDGLGSVLQNPVASVIDGFNYNLSSMYDTITNSTCLSGAEKTSLQTALGTGGVGGLSEQLVNFRTHTDILSGVIAQGTNSTPGLERVLSVGKSLGNLAYAIDGASDCFSLLNNMTGLFSNDLINGYSSQIASMISDINNCIADVANIILRINEMVTTLQNIINADNNFFSDALERLRQAALASLLENMYNNPCGKFIMESKIGQTKLLGYLT